MGILELVIILIIVFAFVGGGWGYTNRETYGNTPMGISGILVVLLIVFLLFRVI